MTLTVADIARHIDAEVIGDPLTEISGLGSLSSAQSGHLSHLSSPTYRPSLSSTSASAVIMTAADADACPSTALVVANPYLAFARASQMFLQIERLAGGIDASARIGERCDIDAQACIGANVVIGDDTQIGAGVKVFANTVIGERCHIAEDVTLRANVTLYSDIKIGARTIIHSGAIIGADGFGFAPDAQGHFNDIAQLGGVTIGADVSIGACSTVDCGAIDDTVINDGVKIDNQVQVGHNCHIGAHTLICGCVGIAGSSVIGKHCVFAGGSGVGGDQPITICDGVTATARTVISRSVDKPGVYSGTVVFHDHSKWRRNALHFMGLNDLFKRVKRLEGRL